MPQPLDSKAESLRQQGVLNPHPERWSTPCSCAASSSTRAIWCRSSTRCSAAFAWKGPPSPRLLCVRVLPSRLLSGPSPLPQRRPAGPDPSTTGTSSCPQTLRPIVQFPAPTSASRPVAPTHRALGAGPKGVRPGGPSSKHRTRLGAQTKKSPMIPEAPREEALVLPDQLWTTRYEELRQRAMAKACAIDHTYAYSLLIRRGLVAWMKAWPRPA